MRCGRVKLHKVDLPRLLTLREIAEATGVPRSTLYTMVADGKIPVLRIGSSIRVTEGDVRALLSSWRQAA